MDIASLMSLSRADALTRGLEVTTNNLANASTDGFKQYKTLFTDYVSRQKAGEANGEKQVQYNQDRSTYLDTMQGKLKQTGNPLDLGINGQGYFMIKTDQGIKLTRNGKFQRSANGTIVDGMGNPLLDDQKQPIQLNDQDQILPLGISSDGTISTERNMVAKLGLATVNDVNTMKAQGNGMFAMKDQNDLVMLPNFEVRQGMLESSNVNPVEATTDMISQQREYDLNFQLLQTDMSRRENAITKIMQTATEA